MPTGWTTEKDGADRTAPVAQYFIVDMSKDIRRQDLDLKTGLVADPQSTLQVGRLLVAQPVLQEATGWQFLISRAGGPR